jgi:hypothetical protein
MPFSTALGGVRDRLTWPAPGPQRPEQAVPYARALLVLAPREGRSLVPRVGGIWSGAASWTRLGKLPRSAFIFFHLLFCVLVFTPVPCFLCSRDPSPEPSAKRAQESTSTLHESSSKKHYGGLGEESRLPAMGNLFPLCLPPSSLTGIAIPGLTFPSLF